MDRGRRNRLTEGAMGRASRSVVVAALAVFAGLSHWATPALDAQEYHVDLEADNRVSFLSDAPLEDFEGVTDRIDGFLLMPMGWTEGEGRLGDTRFYFEVDLGSLDTGIGLRNRHMRDRYLETDRFPFVTFGGTVTGLKTEADGRFQATASGVFGLHGVERNRDVACTALPSSERLRVQCEFDVALSDHDIPIPKLMFMKIDEVMRVRLDIHLVPVTGEGNGGE